MASHALPKPGLADWARIIARKRKLSHRARKWRGWRAVWQFGNVASRLSRSDIAIDCGASDGQCIKQLAANGATVYAFEPDPHGFAGLRTMFDGTPNVHLREQAVSLKEGKAALYRVADFANDPDRFVQASSLFSSPSKGGDAVAVEQIDFCAFIAALPQRVAILKMDIEGAEVPIIERLLDSGLVERIDYIFAETHERLFPDLAARTLALRRRIAREGRHNITLDWI